LVGCEITVLVRVHGASMRKGFSRSSYKGGMNGMRPKCVRISILR
jgi:hypothetical protein